MALPELLPCASLFSSFASFLPAYCLAHFCCHLVSVWEPLLPPVFEGISSVTGEEEKKSQKKNRSYFLRLLVLLESMAATSLALHKVSCFSGEHVEVGTAHLRSSRSVSSRLSLCLLLQILLLCGYLSLSLARSVALPVEGPRVFGAAKLL